MAKPPSFQDQADQLLREEALWMARATQSPGQTKEQTKLIAKGIEKGIAFYKQQQKEKARERDKARKRALKQAQAPSAASVDEAGEMPPMAPSSAPALVVAGTIFLLAGFLHYVRWLLGWEVTVAGHAFPLTVSLAAAPVACVLSAWMFRHALRRE